MIDTDGNLAALNRHLHEREEYEARFITCPECGGVGRCDYELPVINYVSGGFIDVITKTCELCHGTGEIESDEEEE